MLAKGLKLHKSPCRVGPRRQIYSEYSSSGEKKHVILATRFAKRFFNTKINLSHLFATETYCVYSLSSEKSLDSEPFKCILYMIQFN